MGTCHHVTFGFGANRLSFPPAPPHFDFAQAMTVRRRRQERSCKWKIASRKESQQVCCRVKRGRNQRLRRREATTTTMWMTGSSGKVGVWDVSLDDDQRYELLGVAQREDEEEWIVRVVWCEARLVAHCRVSFVFACPKRWALLCLDCRTVVYDSPKRTLCSLAIIL